MSDAAHRPARLLAPLALILFAVAFVAVILTSDAGDDNGSSNESSPASETAGGTGTSTTRRPRTQKRNYTVKVGDSLGAIAEKTGVEVETLQELNPQLDPQALAPGQKIKLRE
jgi:LysM repeat protein